MQLLNPIALLAGAAVIIPVLVHLWNVRKGKTLRVGSIALLATSARQRTNNLRITNWPLFLLRCLLLLLLALLLARPVWNKSPKANTPGWILIPREQLRTAYAQYKPQIDSLLAAGLELHNFSAGFGQLQLQDSIQPIGIIDGCIPNDAFEQVISRWSLLKVLDASLPQSFPLHVFVNNRLSPYHGNRFLTHLNIHWHSFSQGDSMTQSPALSYVTANGEIKNIVSVTTAQGNYYREDQVNAHATPTTDTSIIRIALYAGKHTADAQYIKAALQAIGQFTSRRIQITSLAAGQSPAAPQNLIFQLDEQPGTALLSYVTSKGILFQYDTGAVIHTTSWLQQETQIPGEDGLSNVYRYTTGPVKGTPVWTLANGTPLLTVLEEEGKMIYHYKGRFNPSWGDMVWEDGFVKTLLPWVIPPPTRSNQPDLRTIDDRQVVPYKPTANSRQSVRRDSFGAISHTTKAGDQHTGMEALVWIIAFIVLTAERVLTYRQQQRTQHA